MNQSLAQNNQTRLHTVIINTADMQKLANFYGAGLNLGEPNAHDKNHLGFDLSHVYFGFDLVPNPASTPGPVSLWFEVEDLDETFNRFVQLGASVKYPPTKKPWGAMLAAVFDPDGNVVGLTQRGTNPE